MKKILHLLFLASFAGCIHMHYGIPRGQDISEKNINKVSATVGLYLPLALTNDSVEVTIGDQFPAFLHITTHLQIKDGSAFGQAIQKSVTAVFPNTILIDSLTYNTNHTDSIQLFIKPVFVYRDPKIWSTFGTLTTTFESKIRFDINDKNGNFVDSIFVTAIGVSSRKNDSSAIIDSVMANAADSAIKSLQDQIVERLSKSENIRSFLLLPPAIDPTITIFPRRGIYGKETYFELDTITESLVAIPPIRRWSFWEQIEEPFIIRSSKLNFSLCLDLLLHSHISLRFEAGALIYPGLDNAVVDWNIITKASYLFFGPRNFLEIGLGLNTELGKYFSGIITIPNQRRFEPLGIIGFRHQSIWFGPGLGIYYTPCINANGIVHQLTVSYGFGL